MIGHGLAAVASLLLVVIAIIHVYWGLGGRWPAQDEAGLVATVVGVTPNSKMPGFAMCMVVVVALGIAAMLPLIARELLAIPLPPDWVTIGLWGATGVLALRGLVGFFDHILRPAIVGLPYERLNRRLYSPLCLVLAGLLSASALLPR